MAITLNDNLQGNSPKSLDNKYLKFGTTQYVDVAEVNSTIFPAYRHRGLTVKIEGEEYWYKDGVADIDLVLKTGDRTIVIDSNYNVDNNYKAILVDSSSGPITITIDPTFFHIRLIIIKITSDVNTVTLVPTSGFISGNMDLVINAQYDSVDIVSDQVDLFTVVNGITPGAIALAPVGSTANANAATLTLGVLNLEPANEFFPGVVNTTSQLFAGQKSFQNGIDVYQGMYVSTGALQVLDSTGYVNNQGFAGYVFNQNSNTANRIGGAFGAPNIRWNADLAHFEGHEGALGWKTIPFSDDITGSIPNTIYSGDGTILANRTVNTGNKTLTFTGIDTSGMVITGTGNTNVLQLTSQSGGNSALAIEHLLGFGTAVQIYSENGYAVSAVGAYGSSMGSTSMGAYGLTAISAGLGGDTITPVLRVQRSPDVPGAIGIGASIDFALTNDATAVVTSSRIISRLNTVTAGLESTDLIFQGLYAGSLADRAKLSNQGELLLGDDLTASNTAFFRINKTQTTYLPAFVVEESGGADNFILGQFKGRSNQLYITTTNDDASIVFNDNAAFNYLIIGSTPSQGRAWIRSENTGALDFETNSGTIRARMVQAGDWTFAQNVHIGSGNILTAPTANLHIAGGTNIASGASVKIDSGVLMSGTEPGAIETDGNHIYWTRNDFYRIPLDNNVNIFHKTVADTLGFVDVSGVYLFDTSGGDITYTIPYDIEYNVAGGISGIITVKKITNDSNKVEIDANGGLIDGQSLLILDEFNRSVTLVSDGTNLFKI